MVPIAEEVQLKQAAKVAGEKSVELIPVKEITKITGYVRGGCSPLGMKKLFPTFIHNSAENFDKIYVSGGRIGTTICLDPKELAEVTWHSLRILLSTKPELERVCIIYHTIKCLNA